MILYEYEGKKLLAEVGILVPHSELVTRDSQTINLPAPLVLKAQVLSGKRADAGGIVVVSEGSDIRHQIADMFDKIINGEKVEKILVEEKVEVEKEYYLSISYDTNYRCPVLSVSESGGTGIEERAVKVFPIDPLNPPKDLPGVVDTQLLVKLIELFFSSDCLLLEINPLVQTKEGNWVALDAKVKLDDDAKGRHTDWDFAPRLVPGHTPTQREIDAKKIDQDDYRGTAGAAYLDLEGDIAVLSSGGGISLTAMDALIFLGGKAANFTEYSGNPPKEKVVKLTKIVLSKENIHGLWVVGTVAANFTDIYETLSGLIEGLREAQKELNTVFKMPIVIRRGGPRDKEAFEMLAKVPDFNLILQGEEVSITESARVMVSLAKEYAGKV